VTFTDATGMSAAGFRFAPADFGGNKKRGLGSTRGYGFLIALVRLKVSIERECITLVATARRGLMFTALQGAFTTCYNLEASFCIENQPKKHVRFEVWSDSPSQQGPTFGLHAEVDSSGWQAMHGARDGDAIEINITASRKLV